MSHAVSSYFRSGRADLVCASMLNVDMDQQAPSYGPLAHMFLMVLRKVHIRKITGPTLAFAEAGQHYCDPCPQAV